VTSPQHTPRPSLHIIESTSQQVHILAAIGDVEGMRDLLRKEPFWIAARDANGWTPLHEAARGSHIQIIDLLLQYGADLNALTYTGATPLYEAEKYNGKDSTVYRYLISLGALRNDGKANLRRKAAAVQTVQEMVDQRIPHELAADGSLDELNQLAYIRGDWVLSSVDYNGWTPLHEAARSGRLHVVRYLVQKGVDVNPLSKDGGTPLYYAQNFWGKEASISTYLESQGGIVRGPRL